MKSPYDWAKRHTFTNDFGVKNAKKKHMEIQQLSQPEIYVAQVSVWRRQGGEKLKLL